MSPAWSFGPTVGHASRHSFWEALDHEIEKWHDSPVCALGDFNALEREEEATGLVHAKSLVQPHLQRWRASLAVCDLWRWHGRDEGASSLTRCKPGSQNAGSRIDRGLVSRSFCSLLKKSTISILDWALSDHKVLFWKFEIVSDNEWERVVAERQKGLNMKSWNDMTTIKWQEWLTSLEPKFSS